MPFAIPPLLALACLALALSVTPAPAHETFDETLAQIDAALNTAPSDTELWRRRARLQRDRGDLASAKADLARACTLGLAPALAERERGLNARSEHRLDAAERHLQRARELAPRDVETLVAHAETLAELGRFRAAADSYARVIELTPHPGPEVFLARVRALAAGGGISEALRTLDEAQARLGPVPALAQEGVALELRAGRTDAALARLDLVSAPARRRESWRVQRAEILERSGRSEEAVLEYAAALAELSSTRRVTPAATTLAMRAREGIERLTRSPETSAQ